MRCLWSAVTFVVLLASCPVGQTAQANREFKDPCGGSNSNREMWDCYASEQARVNAEADRLAKNIAADHLKQAMDPKYKGVVADSLRKAASSLKLSQTSWKAYREQHCKAVEYSWTTGSGAGTAYEACMFHISKARLQELKIDFNFQQDEE